MLTVDGQANRGEARVHWTGMMVGGDSSWDGGHTTQPTGDTLQAGHPHSCALFFFFWPMLPHFNLFREIVNVYQ